MSASRTYSLLDKMCISFDQMLRTLTHQAEATGEPNPAAHLPDAPLTERERKEVGSLMRINHAGEVAAQAL
ncbi:MAG TPA: demethoxyubiquinone hydroxylase family protein, partial [Myxococcota bacterium]|nr:demethoxyubiquinone hydroxylase family protein [Myxococcota bacterium]